MAKSRNLQNSVDLLKNDIKMLKQWTDVCDKFNRMGVDNSMSVHALETTFTDFQLHVAMLKNDVMEQLGIEL